MILLVGVLGLFGVSPTDPVCSDTTAHHHRVKVWLTGEGANDETFLSTQLSRANELFAGIDTCFEMETAPLPGVATRVSTRAERDGLGRGRFARGVVHVFVVDRLDDVDVPADEAGELTEIRGVHWRDRANRQRRWIILSRISPPHVLAHELGHFFGLPHGTDPQSIMNKTPRFEPPESKRVFVPAELKKMKAVGKTMRATAFLRDFGK